MPIEIGTIYEGRVTRIASFGAFVALPDNASGMVHISELSVKYVKEINDFVKVGDVLRVKVLSIDDRGRIALSARQAMTDAEIAAAKAEADAERKQQRRNREPAPQDFSHAPGEYTPYVRNPGSASGDSFEDMMSRFKTASDEKISDLRKYTDGKGKGKRGRK